MGNFYKKLRINGNDYKIAVNTGGNGPPTTSTKGALWQGYIDSNSNQYYICLGQNESGEYLWELAKTIPVIIDGDTTTITLRKGTASRWSTVNPILANGEPGFVYDNNKIKIGDGVTPWNSLPYIDGATGIEAFNTYDELPTIGNPSTIYRVIDEKTLYQYNSETGNYEMLNSGGGESISNIKIINGGNA